MLRETLKRSTNRAVSPWFRVFGGSPAAPKADRNKMSERSAMHRAEWIFLGGSMPLMVGMAVFDCLWRLVGPVGAWILTVPLSFVLIHVLVFGFRLNGPLRAFWGWALLLGLWSGWMLSEGGSTPVVWTAWAWLAWLVAQILALVVLIWRWLMNVAGVPGLVVRGLLAVFVHGVMVILWWRYGWQTGVASGAFICGFWALCVFRPSSQIFGPVAQRVQGKGPLLTIDDGPHPDDTPAILDELDEHGVKAVFFVVGEKVAKYPELAREIVNRGHELGNHTMSHPQGSMWILGPWRTWREIGNCQKVIEEVTGQRPGWFRAPVGHRNYFTHPAAAACGLEVVAWTHRAYDTLETDVERVLERLTDGLTDGSVLLMHEATPIAKELAKQLIPKCRVDG